MNDSVQLFDFAGRPIETARQSAPQGVRFVYDPAWLRYDLTPSRGLTGPKLEEYFLLATLNGEVYYQSRLFADIEEKDWDVATALQTRKLAVQGLDWEIVKAPSSSRGKAVADYCTECLLNINFDDATLGYMDAVSKGFSCLQQIWQPGGKLQALEHVEAHNFTFRAVRVDGRERVPPLDVYAPRGLMLGGGALVPRLITREEPVYGLELEPFRWSYHRHQARSGDPARQGLMRTIGWMYLFKMAGVKNYARFVERHGMPFVVAKIDENAWQTDRDKIKQVIRSFGPDGGGVFSRSVEMELLEAYKGGADVYEKLIHYFGDATTKVILGQTLTTGTPHSGGGTRAQGNVHQLVRQDILESDCNAISTTVKRDLLTPMVGFKFGWDEPVPTHQFKYEPAQDMVERAEVTKTLDDAGWVRDQAEMEEEFKMKLTRGQPAPQVTEQINPPGTVKPGATAVPEMHSRTIKQSEAQDALDQLASNTLEKMLKPSVLGPMLNPIHAAIAKAVAHSKTPEEFRGALTALLGEIPTLRQQMNVHHFATTLAEGIGPAMIDGALAAREKS
jgi:phage gp29-like protein